MDLTPFLITGGCGLLGTALHRRAMMRSMRAYSTYHSTPPAESARNYVSLDITNDRSVNELFDRLRPRVVIHTAALTNVDACEIDPDAATRVNARGTSSIASACATAGARMILVSADYVFDGAKGRYLEGDAAHPVNHYGKTKLMAEEATQSLVADSLIVRTSLHGPSPHGLSFSTWILRELSAGREVRGIVDQFSSLMYASDLAEALLDLANSGARGILHVASRDGISKFEFARAVARIFGFDENLVVPVKAAAMTHWKAARPRDVTLDVSRATVALGKHMPGVTEGIQAMKTEVDAQAV
jgi:dTDP-4-dehydrorhamnose reductase